MALRRITIDIETNGGDGKVPRFDLATQSSEFGEKVSVNLTAGQLKTIAGWAIDDLLNSF